MGGTEAVVVLSGVVELVSSGVMENVVESRLVVFVISVDETDSSEDEVSGVVDNTSEVVVSVVNVALEVVDSGAKDVVSEVVSGVVDIV